MRLTTKQVGIIKELVKGHFGNNAKVMLFGSRVDDAAQGGDIDLFIEADCSVEQALKAKMAFYAGLQQKLGEQHIDVVFHRVGSPLERVHEEAQRTGVQL